MSPQPSEIISSLESTLQRSLRPVQPNPEFVNKLHSRLITPASTVLERHAPKAITTPAFFVAGFGLAIGLFLVWIIRQLR